MISFFTKPEPLIHLENWGRLFRQAADKQKRRALFEECVMGIAKTDLSGALAFAENELPKQTSSLTPHGAEMHQCLDAVACPAARLAILPSLENGVTGLKPGLSCAA